MIAMCVVSEIDGCAQNQAAKRMDIRELSEGTVRIAQPFGLTSQIEVRIEKKSSMRLQSKRKVRIEAANPNRTPASAPPNVILILTHFRTKKIGTYFIS